MAIGRCRSTSNASGGTGYGYIQSVILRMFLYLLGMKTCMYLHTLYTIVKYRSMSSTGTKLKLIA